MISYWNKVSTEIVSSYSLNVNCTICASGGQSRLFQDSFCVQIYLFCYLLVHCSHDPYCLSWSWSACQTLSHLQVPLTYVYYFFRSLTNILTNSGIVTHRLFCLNTYFSNMRILTTPLATLLHNGFSYLDFFFSTITSVCVSLQNMLAKAFSVNFCPE